MSNLKIKEYGKKTRFIGYGEEKIGKHVFSIKLPKDVEDKILKVFPKPEKNKERLEFIREAISDALEKIN
jgi:hypothetical protein